MAFAGARVPLGVHPFDDLLLMPVVAVAFVFFVVFSKKFGRDSNVVRDIESAPILAPKKSKNLGKIPM